MRALPTLLAATACLAGAAPSQIVISEVYFTRLAAGDDEWIELRNLGVNSVDVSTWSIYLATDTPGAAKTYWFAFPANTVIGTQSSLRVHWMAPSQPKTLADVYTGNTVYHFLFGYGAEELGAAASGALAVLDTQNNALMNTASVIQDWVTWGSGWSSSTRPIRESLAVQANRWVAGESIAPPLEGHSIALAYPLNAEPTPAAAFFRDASPTPVLNGNPLSGHNHPNAAFAVIERPRGNPLPPCAGPGGTPPTVTALSVAASGNVDFGLRLGGLIPGQLGLLIIGLTSQATPWPLAPGCTFNVGLSPALLLPYAITSTSIDQLLPLEGVPSGTIYAQMVQLATLRAIGFDPGHEITIGS
jgi:hypothetical protein